MTLRTQSWIAAALAMGGFWGAVTALTFHQRIIAAVIGILAVAGAVIFVRTAIATGRELAGNQARIEEAMREAARAAEKPRTTES